MISVIVPVYNLEKHISRTLDSILSQTYKDIEIIVVDDGSTDKTGHIIDDYQKKVSCVRSYHIQNSGVTAARMVGISKAKGEWIGFCDGDDEIDPEMYERLLYNANIFQADISHCGYRMIFDDGRIKYFYNTGIKIEDNRISGLKNLLVNPLFEPGLWNKLFRRELFNNLLCKGIDASIKINEDLLMNFILFSHAEKSVYEDFCPYHYVVRQSSASRQKLNANKIYDPIKVKKRIVEIAPEEIEDEAKAAYLSTCIDIYSILACESSKEFRQDRIKVREKILEKKADVKLLDGRRQALVNLIRYTPHLYPILYQTYVKHFQEKKYD